MTQVQWFPGHMAKALRLIEEQMKIVDFVIECRDARAPHSTRNPALAYYIGQKPRLVILTKRDLANQKETEKWVSHLEEEGHTVLVVDVINDSVKKLMLEKMETVMAVKRERDKRRGIRPRPERALIVGVPNVGKSSIINKISLRKAVNVENRPGVTQSLKLVKVTDTLELIDTPGVLWPKFENQEMGVHIALIGSIKETGFPMELITNYARDYMFEYSKHVLEEKYSATNPETFFEDMGRFRGYLMEEGNIDIDKTRVHFLSDIQNGRLGKITWDRL